MKALFKSAYPYADDAMNLQVENLDASLPFYETIMGFRVTQEGCFFEVDDVEAAFEELKANGLTTHPAWTARGA